MNQSQPTFFLLTFNWLLIVSEESVTDPSLHFVPFRMTRGSSVQDDKGAFSHYSLPRLLGATRRHSRLHPSSRLTVMAGSTPTIIPEKQSFSPGLLHKNATIRGNPALIRPFSPKTPGLLHRPPCPPHSSPCPAPPIAMPGSTYRHARLDRPSQLTQCPLLSCRAPPSLSFRASEASRENSLTKL